MRVKKSSPMTLFALIASIAGLSAAVALVAVPSLLRARVSPGQGHSETLSPPATRPVPAVEQTQSLVHPQLASPSRSRGKGAHGFDGGVPGGVVGGVVGGLPGGLPDGWRDGMNTEAYQRVVDNAFFAVARHPLSTFSIDVDTASYANVRRFLREGRLPPPDAVRIEELVNYFRFDYPDPEGDLPFSVATSVSACPWKPEHKLVHIGLQARRVEDDQAPPRNLVFLLDVSGSMADRRKLPLLKSAMALLVDQLTEKDRVSIVVYAGASGLVLPPTPGDRKGEIRAALSQLQAGGSTAGGAGIQLAYAVARESFIEDGVNRVILATDGDFNVGVTSHGELSRLIEEKRKMGVSLSVLGFGMGNLKDSTMEMLADKGDGNYSYIDSLEEARKVLVTEAGSTLVMVAKDVKLQVEFNPAAVSAYRLIGYENRVLADTDFNDDSKDAGDIGAGHSVTALYEVVPVGVKVDTGDVDPLKYQQGRRASASASAGELATVKLRYKAPGGDTSRLLAVTVQDGAPEDAGAARFAAAVAAFGMLLRDSEHKGSATFTQVLELARDGQGQDPGGYRAEFLSLVERAQSLAGRQARAGG
ncbi:MAG TPA: VWA domain-containing protein [Vicinamibacteria bacterium]|nr:VWA domain-containing protein [Vicinamibacteria bacterium]